MGLSRSLCSCHQNVLHYIIQILAAMRGIIYLKYESKIISKSTITQGSCAKLIWTTCFHVLMAEWAQGFLKLNLHMIFFSKGIHAGARWYGCVNLHFKCPVGAVESQTRMVDITQWGIEDTGWDESLHTVMGTSNPWVWAICVHTRAPYSAAENTKPYSCKTPKHLAPIIRGSWRLNH